ncbi:hypothetical protein V7798_08255 [Rhizobium laguerreae]|jgi:hypothetical protein
MIDHIVPSLLFQRLIIVDVPSAFFQRPDRSAPPDSKKPRQSLTGLCLLKIGRHYVLGGINVCLLPIESGANLALRVFGMRPAADASAQLIFGHRIDTASSSGLPPVADPEVAAGPR